MSFFKTTDVKTKEGENEGFTGNKDVDSEILLKMDDRSFIRTCSVNKYFMFLCEKDNGLLFKRRLQLFYPDTVQYKVGSWKMYYAAVIKAIALLREKYKFQYTKEDPFIQLQILERHANYPERILIDAANQKQYALVEHMFMKHPYLMDSFYKSPFYKTYHH